MDPTALIPVPDTIPVGWGWFQFFLTLTFILHLFFMNAMLGTGIIALFDNFRKPDDLSRSKDIAKKLPFIIAFTVNLGVAPLLFVQVLYGQFMYTSSVLMAFFWLSVIGLVILAYGTAYFYCLKFDSLGQKGRKAAIFIAVAAMLCVGFFFTNNMSMMITPEKWFEYFDNKSGTILNLGDPTLIPRYLHFVFASIAVGGLFTSLVWSLKKVKDSDMAKEKIDSGMKWFTHATLVQVAIGLWFLLALPRDIMLLFMGKSGWATFLLLLAIISAVISLVTGFKKKPFHTAAWAALTVGIMVLVRDLVRSAYLAPYFRADSLKVVSQYSPLFLFLISLVIGVWAVVYMLKLAVEASSKSVEVIK